MRKRSMMMYTLCLISKTLTTPIYCLLLTLIPSLYVFCVCVSVCRYIYVLVPSTNLPYYLSQQKKTIIYLKGLETEHPLVKLGQFVFEGTWDQLMGTALLFKHKNNNHAMTDENEKGKDSLEYSNIKTRKVLRLVRIILRPNDQQSSVISP
jgi:hypothetical protein